MTAHEGRICEIGGKYHSSDHHHVTIIKTVLGCLFVSVTQQLIDL